MTHVHECTFELKRDEDTGKKYWHGYCEGDKQDSPHESEKPLILETHHFPVGYRVDGWMPWDEETEELILDEDTIR